MITIKDLSQPQQLANFTGVVLFSAPWCSPCVQYKPALENWCTARLHPLLKVDVDAHRELAAQFGVRAVPTTTLMKDGRPVKSFAGARTFAALDAALL